MTRRYPYQFIDFKQPLVDPATGRITPYFQRQLFGQTENAEDVSDQVDDFADAITALKNDKADKATLINTGFGLSGGGDLSDDRTLALGNPALVDPEADRILFWDDSEGELRWLTIGANLTITDDTISASGGGGGGGGGSLTPPVLADYPIVVGSPTAATLSSGAVRIATPASGTAIQAVLRTVPSGNFSVRAKIQTRQLGNFNGTGIIFRNSGGAFSNCGFVFNSTRVAVIDNFSSAFSFAGGAAFYGFGITDDMPTWIRADFDAATNVITCYWSWNGADWEVVGTTSYLGAPDAIGFGHAVNGPDCLSYWESFVIL